MLNKTEYTCLKCETSQQLVGGQRFCSACRAPLPASALARVPALREAVVVPDYTRPPLTLGLRLVALRVVLVAFSLLMAMYDAVVQLPALFTGPGAFVVVGNHSP